MANHAAFVVLGCALVWMPASQARDSVDLDAPVVAMGGAGTACAPPAEASFLNPALLVPCQQSVSPANFVHLYGGAHFIDRKHLREGLRAYHDLDPQSALTRAIAAVDAKLDAGQLPTQAQLDTLRTAAQQLVANLRALPNRPLELQADGGFSAGKSERDQGVGAFVRQQYLGGALLSITEHDKTLLDATLTQVEAFIRQVQAGVPLSSLTPPADPKNQMTSSFTLSGAIVTQQGMSWAVKPDRFSGTTAFGVSLKAVRIQGVAFDATLENARRSQFILANNSRNWNVPEMDVGLVSRYGSWRFGLVAENLFAHDFTLPDGRSLSFSTMARAGVAYLQSRWMIVADLDLTANQPYGYVTRRRELAAGMQYAIGDGIDLRAGWRCNLVNGRSVPSAGFGWNGRRAQLDLAVSQYNDEYAAALSLGMRF